MHKFHTISPQQFLDYHGQPKNLQQFHKSVPCFGTDPTAHSRHFLISSMHFNAKFMEFKTQTAPNFWAVTDGGKNHQEFLTIRSHVLGPIKRPLTASNQPKHRKTLKNGNKTQVGRKSYLLELSKTRKPGVHA